MITANVAAVLELDGGQHAALPPSFEEATPAARDPGTRQSRVRRIPMRMVDRMADGLESEEHPETWALLNEELRLRLDVQRAAFARIEGRAAIVLAAAFTALQFVAREPVSSRWLAPALVSYGLSMLAGLIAVWPSRFEELKPRSLLFGLWLYSHGRASAEMANARLQAFEVNVARQHKLVSWVRVSVVLALVGAMMSLGHFTQGNRSDVERPVTTGCTSPGGTGGCSTSP